MRTPLPLAAALLGLLAACGGDVSPTQPSSIPAPGGGAASDPTPTPGFGAIEGRVTDADTGEQLVAVRIDASSGTTSFSVTTNTAGAFRMDLPPGVARVTATKEGYLTYNRAHTIQTGPMTLQIALAKIVIPPPPPQPTYTLMGLVIDANRNLIGDAAIRGCCINDSPIDGMFGMATTDASGQFRLVTTRSPDSVWVFKRGYQQLRANVGRFEADSTANITIVVPRFVRLVVTPVSVKVGQEVSVDARLETDVGSSFPSSLEKLTSSDPSVLAVTSYRTVKGMAPGTATVTATDWSGLTATMPLSVSP